MHRGQTELHNVGSKIQWSPSMNIAAHSACALQINSWSSASPAGPEALSLVHSAPPRLCFLKVWLSLQAKQMVALTVTLLPKFLALLGQKALRPAHTLSASPLSGSHCRPRSSWSSRSTRLCKSHGARPHPRWRSCRMLRRSSSACRTRCEQEPTCLR